MLPPNALQPAEYHKAPIHAMCETASYKCSYSSSYYYIITSSPWTVTLSCQDSYLKKMTYKPSILAQTEFFGTSAHAGLQLRLAVITYATVINTHTPIQAAFRRLCC